MTITESPAVSRCVDGISATFDTVFGRVAAWRDAFEQQIGARPSVAELDALVDAIVLPQFAASDNLIIGAGFVAAPGYLSDSEWHISWWLGQLNTFGVDGATPEMRRLLAVEDPESENFRDYTALEWWRVPVQTGAQHITGPYVDYLCTDEYTLTLTAPVHADGSLIGVVGADLYVDDIESVLLPRLYELGAPTTLVNASARIVASTDAHRATGSLLRSDGLTAALAATAGASASAERAALLPGGERVVACGDTSLSLVIGQG
ncbi:hypothetical protein EV379_1124 [Microterricola gilva]|uniref:Cache domain-containing protein n=1 Tax=Microterricola gilva TaxID=393267 RepID=A0A4Q8ALP6_9MICO|nr:cache domain-containing protein [Microterricola gilva]RZU64815.1 hypothetical protein EV379_1124 [Microterricola gilva]